MRNKPKVLIIVQGGIVQDIYSTEDIDVQVKDWDNLKEGDVLDYDPQGFDYPNSIVSEEEIIEISNEDIDDLKNSLIDTFPLGG